MHEDFDIDVDPVPFTDNRKKARPVSYPFDSMDVGTSFTSPRTMSTLKFAIRMYHRKGGKRHFAVRETEGGKRRVWRVK